MAQGQHLAAYILGKNLGFFADHGIDPTFLDGSGSTAISQQVAAGNIDLAVNITPPSALSVAAAGGGLIAIGAPLPILPQGVVTLTEIDDPSDLKGMTSGVPAGTLDAAVWPSFMAAHGLTDQDVTTVNIATNALDQSLASGSIDGLVAFTYTHVAILKGMGFDAHVLSFSDFGLDVAPGQSIVVNSDWIAKPENQQLAREFLSATAETISYALAHPDEVAAAGVAFDSTIFTEEPIKLQLQAMADLIRSTKPEILTSSASSVVLGMDEADWDNQIKVLTDLGVLPADNTLTAGDVMTTQYLS
jgi:ABC-type nitrate/sulfonate/bicarbonate transport system substrate-binding protein